VKHFVKLTICLAGGLALNAGLRADDVVLPGNPYAPLVARNVFGLNPIVVADDTQAPDPPAKITPNGIMSIFGHLQVLFKVSGAIKAGKPAGDESYILAEGQRQDDIEVTHIDQKAGIVTFDNHGVVQKLPLANAVASSAPMPASTPFQNFAYPAAGSGGNNNGTGFGRFGNRGGGGRNRSNGNNGTDNSSGGGNDEGSYLRTVPTRTVNDGQSDPQAQGALTPEQSMILIAAQHAKLQQEGNPMSSIFPPTPVDTDAGVISTPTPGGPPMP
jgi:hypothetical protein